MFSTDYNFSLNIFDPWLIESTDMETMDIEDQLYVHLSLFTIYCV